MNDQYIQDTPHDCLVFKQRLQSLGWRRLRELFRQLYTALGTGDWDNRGEHAGVW